MNIEIQHSTMLSVIGAVLKVALKPDKCKINPKQFNKCLKKQQITLKTNSVSFGNSCINQVFLDGTCFFHGHVKWN